MTDCPRFGKLFNGCKFEGRYDREPLDQGALSRFKTLPVQIAEMLRRKTYVHDICIRCGKTVKRP